MASLYLPDRFITRPVDDFVRGLDLVTAWYWHLHERGDITGETNMGLSAIGSLEAIHWLAGTAPFPPAYGRPLERKRSNLLRLVRYAEMVLSGEGEELDQEDPAADITDMYRIAGARNIYQWALRMSDTIPGDMLLPEEIRAARQYFARLRSRSAA